jgi:hypothetical protein
MLYDPVSRVIGRDTSHYTITESIIDDDSNLGVLHVPQPD